MTKHYDAGPGAGIAQAVPVPHLAERVAGAQAVQVRRRASETAAALPDLPADPFARRPRLRGPGSWQLSEQQAVFVLASLIVALLASSAAPTPLYAIYQTQWHFTPITTTVVFGVYAMAVLVALLTLGKLSDHGRRRPVLLTAISVHAGSLVIFATATGVACVASGPGGPGPVYRRGPGRDRRGHAGHGPRARHVRQRGGAGHGQRERRDLVRAGGPLPA